MIQVNGFLCHPVATKTEGNCDEIGHATFSDATFSDATFSDATFSDATVSDATFSEATFSYKTEKSSNREIAQSIFIPSFQFVS